MNLPLGSGDVMGGVADIAGSQLPFRLVTLGKCPLENSVVMVMGGSRDRPAQSCALFREVVLLVVTDRLVQLMDGCGNVVVSARCVVCLDGTVRGFEVTQCLVKVVQVVVSAKVHSRGGATGGQDRCQGTSEKYTGREHGALRRMSAELFGRKWQPELPGKTPLRRLGSGGFHFAFTERGDGPLGRIGRWRGEQVFPADEPRNDERPGIPGASVTSVQLTSKQHQ